MIILRQCVNATNFVARKGHTHCGGPLPDALQLTIQLFSNLGACYTHDDRESDDRSHSSKELRNSEGIEKWA